MNYGHPIQFGTFITPRNNPAETVVALGAGAFWEAIEAMGGRRLAPGEAVAALGEAIEVIRGMLDTGEGTPLRFKRDYYHLDGAQRGPGPAHDIPIWLGALKPRMLRLTGQKADGWLPSITYLKPGEFQAGNQIIDEAALEAGRGRPGVGTSPRPRLLVRVRRWGNDFRR